MAMYRRRRFNIFKDDNDILSDATFSLPGDHRKSPPKTRAVSSPDTSSDLLDAPDEDDLFSIGIQSVARSARKKVVLKVPEIIHSSLLRPLDHAFNNSMRDNSFHHPINLRDFKAQDDTWHESSIHLSEFEQPPQSTSTPNKGLFLTPVKSTTSFNKRPDGYSTPMFKFDSKSFDPEISWRVDDSGCNIVNSDDSVMRSPLAYKNRHNDLKYDLNVITDKFHSLLINSPLSDTHDEAVAGVPYSHREIAMEDVSSNGPLRDIRKVKIDERDDRVLDSRKRTNTRPSTPRRKKKRVTHDVDPDADYDNFKRLCGTERDPLDIVLH